MAMTLRLKPELQLEAAAYAEGAGVSLNALLSLALRDYLDARRRMQRSAPSSPRVEAPVFETSSPSASSAPAAVYKAPKSRADPCPCGSRLKWKQCHGKLA